MPRPQIPTTQKVSESARLKDVIKAAKKLNDSITQEAIALELGVTQSLIHQWLSGKTRISDRQLFKLAKLLSFDPLEIRPDASELSIPLIKETGIGERVAKLVKMTPPEKLPLVEAYLLGLIDSSKPTDE